MESWIELFKAVFSANTPEWANTLTAWALLFHEEGRTDDQIRQAIRRVALREVRPKYPSDLTAALQAELRELDRQAKTARESQRLEYRPAACVMCQDSGWVSGLPHLECVDGPIWSQPRWTVAVTCYCDKGRRFQDHFATREHEPKKITGFLEYSKQNPHYLVQMKQRQLEADAQMASYEQQHGPHPGRLLLEKILARHRSTSPRGPQDAGGLTVAPLGEVPATTPDGEILNEMDW